MNPAIQQRATEACPSCEKCSAPLTTGMLAMFCPHGRSCALVGDDGHWVTREPLSPADAAGLGYTA